MSKFVQMHQHIAVESVEESMYNIILESSRLNTQFEGLEYVYEGVGETIGKVFSSIWSGIKKFLGMVKNFITKIISKIKKFLGLSKEIKSEMKKESENKSKEETKKEETVSPEEEELQRSKKRFAEGRERLKKQMEEMKKRSEKHEKETEETKEKITKRHEEFNSKMDAIGKHIEELHKEQDEQTKKIRELIKEFGDDSSYNEYKDAKTLKKEMNNLLKALGTPKEVVVIPPEKYSEVIKIISSNAQDLQNTIKQLLNKAKQAKNADDFDKLNVEFENKYKESFNRVQSSSTRAPQSLLIFNFFENDLGKKLTDMLNDNEKYTKNVNLLNDSDVTMLEKYLKEYNGYIDELYRLINSGDSVIKEIEKFYKEERMYSNFKASMTKIKIIMEILAKSIQATSNNIFKNSKKINDLLTIRR